MAGDLIARRHRAWVEVLEAPERINISLEQLRGFDGVLDLRGPTLTIPCGQEYAEGLVAYKIDGWDADNWCLTARKIQDTRPR